MDKTVNPGKAASPTAVITILRHGEKDATGNLTQQGSSQSRSVGLATKFMGGDVILFHSGVARVKETIAAVAKHIHLTADSPEEVLAESNFQEYTVPSLHYLHNPSVKGELFSGWDNIEETSENITQRMEAFLAYGDTSPEPEVFPSPRQMAKNVARLLILQLELALLTTEADRFNFLNGTHEPVLMSFLGWFLNAYKAPSPGFVNSIGGSVGYAEGIDFEVYQQGSTEIVAVFRGKNYPVDLKALRTFLRS